MVLPRAFSLRIYLVITTYSNVVGRSRASHYTWLTFVRRRFDLFIVKYCSIHHFRLYINLRDWVPTLRINIIMANLSLSDVFQSTFERLAKYSETNPDNLNLNLQSSSARNVSIWYLILNNVVLNTKLTVDGTILIPNAVHKSVYVFTLWTSSR